MQSVVRSRLAQTIATCFNVVLQGAARIRPPRVLSGSNSVTPDVLIDLVIECRIDRRIVNLAPCWRSNETAKQAAQSARKDSSIEFHGESPEELR